MTDVDDLVPALRGIAPAPQVAQTATYLAEHLLYASATGRHHSHLRLQWENQVGWKHYVMDQHGTWLLLHTVPRVVESVHHLVQVLGYRVQQ